MGGWGPDDKNGESQAQWHNTEWQLQEGLDDVVPELALTVRWLDVEKELRKGENSREHHFQKAMREGDIKLFLNQFKPLTAKEWAEGQKIVLDRVQCKLKQNRTLLVSIFPKG